MQSSGYAKGLHELGDLVDAEILRDALRAFRHRRTVALTIIVTLTLGIGVLSGSWELSGLEVRDNVPETPSGSVCVFNGASLRLSNSVIAGPIDRANCRGASNSGWRSPGRWRIGRSCCWRTSRRGIWIPTRAWRFWP